MEYGEWAEPLRQIVDGRLPWLPHRTGRELARMYRVTIASQAEKTVQLKLELPGAATGSDILLTVSREHGLPTLWESRLGGEVALRLRFEEMGEAAGKPIWKKVVAEDRAGREVERWELTAFHPLKTEIAPVDSGWSKYVAVDLRNPLSKVIAAD